jgi:MYXO-CTERM domain-containing protein
MKLRNLLKALFVFAILGIAGQVHGGVAAPRPTVSETFGPGGLSGTYTVNNPLFSGVSVLGFAIENNLATDTSTSRTRWFAGLVSRAQWGNYDIFPSPDEGPLFQLGDVGDFDAIFGSDADQVALYYANERFPLHPSGLLNTIGPGESSSQFTWIQDLIGTDSEYVLFDQNGNIIGQGSTAPAAAPEPSFPALLALGLAALAAMRRRTKAA